MRFWLGRSGVFWIGICLSLLGIFASSAISVRAAEGTTRLAIVPGGPHPYFAAMEAALDDAKRAFTLKDGTYRVPASFSLNDQNQTVERLAAQGYNAFALFPDDANGTNVTISELAGRGIPSAVIGACTNAPSNAKFCLATDVGRAAYDGAKRAILAIGGSGKIVHLTGLLVDPNTRLREDGVARAIAEAHGKVRLTETIADIDSPEAAARAVDRLMDASGSTIDGIVCTAYNPAVAAAKKLMSSRNHRIKLIAIDVDPIVLGAIKDGFVAGTVEQNPYGQAYVAAYALDQMVSHGCKMKAGAPFKIDSGTIFVTKRNAGTHVNGLHALTVTLQKQFRAKYLEC